MVELHYTPAHSLERLEDEDGICEEQNPRSCDVDRLSLVARQSQTSLSRGQGDDLLTDVTCCTRHSALSARACQCDRWRMDPGPAAVGCQAQHTMLAAPRPALASSLDHMTPSCIAANFFKPQSITLDYKHVFAATQIILNPWFFLFYHLPCTKPPRSASGIKCGFAVQELTTGVMRALDKHL